MFNEPSYIPRRRSAGPAIRSLLRSLAPVAALVGFAHAQPPAEADRLLLLIGSSPNTPSDLGTHMCPLADIDGDFAADFVVAGRGTAIAYSGSTGAQLWSRTFPWPIGSFFPYVPLVARVGDIDGDGVPDVGVGEHAYQRVTILSGATGATLRQTAVPANGYSPAAIVSLGSIDGDQLSEYAVASDGLGITVFDGATGNALATFSTTSFWSVNVAALGDVDADGAVELAGVYPQGHSSSEIVIHSMGSSTPLASFTSTTSRFTSIAADDFDDDGAMDIVCGSPQTGPSQNQNSTGSITAFAIDFANSTLVPRFSRAGINTEDRYGFSVASAGDIDLDGVRDIAVGAVGRRVTLSSAGTAGRVEVLSGDTGNPLSSRATTFQGTWYGYSVANLGDTNDDGLEDLGVGEPLYNPYVNPSNQATGNGNVRVYTPALPTMAAAPIEISAGAGGTQTIDITAGPAFAGQTYAIFGSASGFAPGLQLGPRVLPLNQDWYFDFVVQNANSATYTNTFAQLDANGAAQATINLPAGTLGFLVGLSVQHAAAITPSDWSATTWTTNATRMTIVP